MNNHHDHTPDASDAGPLLTAHALNELSEREQGQVEQILAADPQAGQTVEEVKRLATALRETCVEPAAPPVVALREAVVARLDELEAAAVQVELAQPIDSVWRRKRVWITIVAAAAACVVVVALTFGDGFRAWNPHTGEREIESAFNKTDDLSKSGVKVKALKRRPGSSPTSQGDEEFRLDDVPVARSAADRSNPHFAQAYAPQDEIGANSASGTTHALSAAPVLPDASAERVDLPDFGARTAPKNDLGKSIGAFPGPGIEGRADRRERFNSGGQRQPEIVDEFMASPPNKTPSGSVTAPLSTSERARLQKYRDYTNRLAQKGYSPSNGDPKSDPLTELGIPQGAMITGIDGYGLEGTGVGRATVAGGEQYEAPPENAFLPVDKATALSTFSIDVDTASYANVRRFLSQNQLPPPHAVRIEEMLNYFRYSYPQPQGEDRFSVSMELADCPWQPGHELLRIGIKGKEVEAKARKAGNLVFLVDVSGSMQPENKLPLLKQSLKMLTGELTENDTVTIVTYAGDAGLKLDATNGTRQNEIRAAIDSLSAGGSTHGSAGIELAYQQAAKSFIKGGTNRVILATDGDLNVGITSDDALVELIKTKAAGGVFLTVLGVGEGNLKDAKMEKLADNGNGVYAYLDSLREARKVLVEQLAGSLETIAKDVKLQIEFNPAEVQAYRLIGYENRVLATRDFHDDKKDAGEIGAGHTVTALYELVPARAKAAAKAEARGEGEPLKYQKTPDVKPAPEALTPAAGNGEVLTLKLRFKQPDAETSKLREYPLKSEAARFNRASADFQFAAAVASFGMLLKNSQHRGDATFSAVEEIAAGSVGPDPSGYRAEFLDLVRKAKTLK